MRIKGKKVLLGVTGGVAAYKALEIVRLLARSGAECQVVMTRSATELIRPESFEALTGRKAAWDLWESDRAFRPAVAFGPETRPIHIDMAQRADLFLVAPATANVIAKMSAGIADDLLTTAYLAATCPVHVAPAMNKFMWEHPATRRNIARLTEDGVKIIPPEAGDLACGYEGVGRLASPEAIAENVISALRRGSVSSGGGDLSGKKIVVTAGRTEEPIDPVRVLTNRSSGRMGVALAEEAARRGAEVIFIHGALSVPLPHGCIAVEALTAEAMEKEVLHHGPSSDALIMAAAVGDFRPKEFSTSKRKRTGPVTLDLEPTADILSLLSKSRGALRVLAGFALETDSPEERGREKLERKGLDLVVVNRPEVDGGGIGKEKTEALLLGKDGFRAEIPLASKREIAAAVLDRVSSLL